jgi:hypothetical protein
MSKVKTKKHYGYVTGGSRRKRLTLCGIWLPQSTANFVKYKKDIECGNCKRTRVYRTFI